MTYENSKSHNFKKFELMTLSILISHARNYIVDSGYLLHQRRSGISEHVDALMTRHTDAACAYRRSAVPA
jgi:hypothetical protein